MKHRAKLSGFTRVDLLLILLGFVAVAVVILPWFTRGPQPMRIRCSNNLKQVGIAFRSWGLAADDKFPMQTSVTNGGVLEPAAQGSAYAVFLVMSNDLVTPKILFCPEDTTPLRKPAQVFGAAAPSGLSTFGPSNNLSYFVGLDATVQMPQSVLTGDDHLLVSGSKPRSGLLLISSNAPVAWAAGRHPYGGNIGLADGSVENHSSDVQTAFAQSGRSTNRLAMP